MKNSPFLRSLSVASLWILAPISQAAVLVYEGFNYGTRTGIPTATLNGGSGFSGAWNSAGNAVTNASIVAGSLTPANPSGLATSGNSFSNNNGGNNGGGTSFLDRNFTTPVGGVAQSEVWYSFIVAPANTVAGNKSIFTLRNGGSNILNMGDVGDNAPLTPSNFGFNWNGGTFVDSGIPMTTANTFIVAKIAQGLGLNSTSVAMWIDPVDVSSEAAMGEFPSASAIGLANFSFTNVQIASRNGALDEFSLGTTLADVALVPEPATMALVMVAALGFTGLRRRS